MVALTMLAVCLCPDACPCVVSAQECMRLCDGHAADAAWVNVNSFILAVCHCSYCADLEVVCT